MAISVLEKSKETLNLIFKPMKRDNQDIDPMQRIAEALEDIADHQHEQSKLMAQFFSRADFFMQVKNKNDVFTPPDTEVMLESPHLKKSETESKTEESYYENLDEDFL